MTFRVEIKIRNALLYNAIMRQHPNVHQFCIKNGFQPTLVGNLLNLKDSPLLDSSEWRQPVLDLCDVLGFLPDELFPDHLKIRLEKSTAALEMTQDEVMVMLEASDPVKLLENKELIGLIENNLSKLSPRYAYVIRRRFGIGCGAVTLNELGQEMGITPQRVRQIEMKSLRFLRHPDVAGEMRDYYEGEA